VSVFYNVARFVSRAFGPNSAVVRAVRPISERVLRSVVGRRGLAWEINGVPCRINPQFRAQFARYYDAALAAILQKEINSGQVCLDVGANIGVWVIQFASLVGPTGRVVAFEPNPGARAVLEEHIGLNDLGSVVRVVPAAIGAVPGEVAFFAAGADGMSRIGEPNPLLAERVVTMTVRVTTLDSWCRENAVRPDWLFIDIEGYEGHALAGAAETIRTVGPNLGIVVEMHPTLWSASGTTRDEVAARIADLGRRAVPLTGQADPFGEYGHVRLEPL